MLRNFCLSVVFWSKFSNPLLSFEQFGDLLIGGTEICRKEKKCWLLVVLLPVFARALLAMLCSENFRSISVFLLAFSPTFLSFAFFFLVLFVICFTMMGLWESFVVLLLSEAHDDFFGGYKLAASANNSFRDMKEERLILYFLTFEDSWLSSESFFFGVCWTDCFPLPPCSLLPNFASLSRLALS